MDKAPGVSLVSVRPRYGAVVPLGLEGAKGPVTGRTGDAPKMYTRVSRAAMRASMLIFLAWLVVASYFMLRILLGLLWACGGLDWSLFLCPLGCCCSVSEGLRLGFSHFDHVTSGGRSSRFSFVVSPLYEGYFHGDQMALLRPSRRQRHQDAHDPLPLSLILSAGGRSSGPDRWRSQALILLTAIHPLEVLPLSVLSPTDFSPHHSQGFARGFLSRVSIFLNMPVLPV